MEAAVGWWIILEEYDLMIGVCRPVSWLVGWDRSSLFGELMICTRESAMVFGGTPLTEDDRWM